jgi:hypothetical protein
MKPVINAFSLVFHPLLILMYMLVMMLLVNPYMFGYRTIREADSLLLMVFLTSVLIPVIAILVMKGIGWVHSFQMSDRHERIGPYLVTSVLYLSLYLHFVKAKAFPSPILIATLGAVIALFAGFFLNNFRKISMHALSIGGLFVMTIFLLIHYSTNLFILPLPFGNDLRIPSVYLLYCVILLCGVICSIRLAAGAHNRFEVYAGFLTGAISMCIAQLIVT